MRNFLEYMHQDDAWESRSGNDRPSCWWGLRDECPESERLKVSHEGWVGTCQMDTMEEDVLDATLQGQRHKGAWKVRTQSCPHQQNMCWGWVHSDEVGRAGSWECVYILDQGLVLYSASINCGRMLKQGSLVSNCLQKQIPGLYILIKNCSVQKQ